MLTPDEEKIIERDSGYRLGCPECTEHFTDEKSRKEHLKTHCKHREDDMVHCKTCDPEDEWSNHPSGHSGNSDFKNGGKVFN